MRPLEQLREEWLKRRTMQGKSIVAVSGAGDEPCRGVGGGGSHRRARAARAAILVQEPRYDRSTMLCVRGLVLFGAEVALPTARASREVRADVADAGGSVGAPAASAGGSPASGQRDQSQGTVEALAVAGLMAAAAPPPSPPESPRGPVEAGCKSVLDLDVGLPWDDGESADVQRSRGFSRWFGSGRRQQPRVELVAHAAEAGVSTTDVGSGEETSEEVETPLQLAVSVNLSVVDMDPFGLPEAAASGWVPAEAS